MAGKIIVGGAGASGLMAAISAARAGASVTILEAMERPGKKLLMTGNGRCNLTNMDDRLAEAYHGAEPVQAAAVLRRFDAVRTRNFFRELGLLTVEKNGYVYPYTNQASSVLEVLLAEVRRLGIRLKLSEKIVGIERRDGKWQVRTATWTYPADALILCCGSKCMPSTGSDGSGYALAQMAGLPIQDVSPALVPLVCEESFLPALAGVRCHARVTLQQAETPEVARQAIPSHSIPAQTKTENQTVSGQIRTAKQSFLVDPEIAKQQKQENQGRKTESSVWQEIASETGEVQWVRYGLSGIAVFQLSRHVSAARPGTRFRILLDLFSPFCKEELEELLQKRAASLFKEPPAVLLRGLLPEKLIPVVLSRAKIPPKQRCGALDEQTLARLLAVCRSFALTVSGTKSFDVCQVCAGGVSLHEVDPRTLECQRAPGLYLAGELLDIDGPCGGYNLQWAWASGYVAGTSAGQSVS